MSNWIFQGNPERYDVLGDLEAGVPIESWSVTRHISDLRPGDRAALWVAGRRSPGVYAVGEVTGEPFEALVTDSGWRRPADQGALMWFCRLRFDRVLLDDPIPRDELRADARFAGARILTQPQAGNPFLTDDEEWAAIEDRLSARRPSELSRSADNVWLEVQHQSRRWMDEGTPVFTLSRNVRNYITGVSDAAIERRSEEGRSERQTVVPKSQITRLWEALATSGDTDGVSPMPLRFAYALLQRAVPGIAFASDPYRLVLVNAREAGRTFVPGGDDVPGLARRRGRGRGGGGGGGGEGPVHAELKRRVKEDPLGTVGERLTYVSEDLAERLGDEVRFVTGDRVDLLMKDESGDYVVIEVEPTVGPDDHVGFHQAAKYWVLVAVAKQIELERVRRMVVAASIDARLAKTYFTRYGIESCEVSLD